MCGRRTGQGAGGQGWEGWEGGHGEGGAGGKDGVDMVPFALMFFVKQTNVFSSSTLTLHPSKQKMCRAPRSEGFILSSFDSSSDGPSFPTVTAKPS